jgi:hypothetical protein
MASFTASKGRESVYTSRTCHFCTHKDPPLCYVVAVFVITVAFDPFLPFCNLLIKKESESYKINCPFSLRWIKLPLFFKSWCYQFFFNLCSRFLIYPFFLCLLQKNIFIWLFYSKCDYYNKNLELIQRYTTLLKNCKFQI